MENKCYSFRLSDDVIKKLEYIADAEGIKRVDALESAIINLYKLEKKKQKVATIEECVTLPGGNFRQTNNCDLADIENTFVNIFGVEKANELIDRLLINQRLVVTFGGTKFTYTII